VSEEALAEAHPRTNPEARLHLRDSLGFPPEKEVAVGGVGD
jgi:hypothetical protein